MDRIRQADSYNQSSLLAEATNSVKEHAYYMKRAIDQDGLRDALKHASSMLCELRTSFLSPKHYYELYMLIFQEMRDLSNFFDDKSRHGRKMSELYDSVQHAGNIIPRLFLLITAGACYIRSLEAPAKEILKDMSELCKGVQHPMRGLFLRYFLIQTCRDVLPDTGSIYEKNGGGDVLDSWEFLYSNFCESTRLWIRLQNHGTPKDKMRRERERHDLRILVGANLVRVSHLEGLTQQLYIQEILPKLLSVVLSCEDVLAQQYLLDCIIQVFSDENHLKTLELLLSACMKTLPGVDLKPILTNLMNRLSNFLSQTQDKSLISDIDIFELFRKHLAELNERPNPTQKQVGNTLERDLSSLLDLHSAFLTFTLTIYPNNTHYVDLILGSTVTLLTNALGVRVDGTCGAFLEPRCVDTIIEILSVPFQSMPLSIMIEMDHFPNLLYFLNNHAGRRVAISLINTIVENNTPLNNIEALQRFCSFILPMLEGGSEIKTAEEVLEDSNEFIHEQMQISKLVHQITGDNLNYIFAMYEVLYDLFHRGTSINFKYTLPTLGYCALKLINELIESEKSYDSESRKFYLKVNMESSSLSIRKLLKFVHKTATELSTCSPEIALDLFLQGSVVSSAVAGPNKLEAICYEFIIQGLVCFEEELSESKKQFQGLMSIIGTLINITGCLSENEYETIATKLTQYSAKLLRKPDQCRAILMCSHLFWNNKENRDANRVLECLQKCLKIADSAVQVTPANSVLFIDILEKYMYFLEQGSPNVTTDFISKLVTLCHEQIRFSSSEIPRGPKILLNNLTTYINNEKTIYKNIEINELLQVT